MISSCPRKIKVSATLNDTVLYLISYPCQKSRCMYVKFARSIGYSILLSCCFSFARYGHATSLAKSCREMNLKLLQENKSATFDAIANPIGKSIAISSCSKTCLSKKDCSRDYHKYYKSPSHVAAYCQSLFDWYTSECHRYVD